MEILGQAVDIFLHLDVYLNAMAASMGPWLYVLLFAVIFCETASLCFAGRANAPAAKKTKSGTRRIFFISLNILVLLKTTECFSIQVRK